MERVSTIRRTKTLNEIYWNPWYCVGYITKHLQRWGIYDWQRRKRGSVDLVNKSSHILFNAVNNRNQKAYLKISFKFKCKLYILHMWLRNYRGSKWRLVCSNLKHTATWSYNILLRVKILQWWCKDMKFVFPTEVPYVRFVSIRNIGEELRTHVIGSANNLDTSRSHMLRLLWEV